MSSETTLPQLLAGPIVRRFTTSELVLWLVTSERLSIHATVEHQQQQTLLFDAVCEVEPMRIGEHAYVYLLVITWSEVCQDGDVLSYDLHFVSDMGSSSLVATQPDLLFPNETCFTLLFRSQVKHILHGSCRKPHHPGSCGLAVAGRKLATQAVADRPALLMMSGDQIYADDVAGPMLSVIQQTIERLGLWSEKLEGALIDDSEALFASPYCYYGREELLPQDKHSQQVEKKLFIASRKPIFTSDSAHNHLMTLAEMLAMYLLVWSDSLWVDADWSYPTNLASKHQAVFDQEAEVLQAFVRELPDTRRLLAHVPVYMIFDDHDVTDDWNLTRDWEETAYNHPLSRRIIGNAMTAYFLCQAWGNDPARFVDNAEIIVREHFAIVDENSSQDAMINDLLKLENWHYSVPTSPPVLVLDTRTRRWRSESNANKPSGLLDWEALSELQSELINHDAVILVSAAPIFGVKLIEAIQRLFTLAGKPLMVDAENWMAHKGTANVILNIFSHRQTPRNFVILSGDVHYSFAYDVSLRRGNKDNHIWQITASGFKNTFPDKLLTVFDRLNRLLFDAGSPLNWLTQRRRMKIRSRSIDNMPHRYLLNRNGIGHVTLNRQGEPVSIELWSADEEVQQFVRRE